MKGRDDRITLKRWRTVVSREKGARFAGDGDVEIRFDPIRDQWIRVFRYRSGQITFTTRVNAYACPDPVILQSVKRFARDLDARLLGEEHEEYFWHHAPEG